MTTNERRQSQLLHSNLHAAGDALLLASASPRRAELLQQLGLQFKVQVADIDESPRVNEQPLAYVTRMAQEKAQCIATRLAATSAVTTCILAADTTVVVADTILGKPVDAAQAVAFLRRLSGRRHQVLSAVCLLYAGQLNTLVQTSAVTFMPLTDQQISRYVASGEPMGKAGAYAIQGRAAAFVTHLDGSYSGVMGLPLAETAALLRSVQLMPY